MEWVPTPAHRMTAHFLALPAWGAAFAFFMLFLAWCAGAAWAAAAFIAFPILNEPQDAASTLGQALSNNEPVLQHNIEWPKRNANHKREAQCTNKGTRVVVNETEQLAMYETKPQQPARKTMTQPTNNQPHESANQRTAKPNQTKPTSPPSN